MELKSVVAGAREKKGSEMDREFAKVDVLLGLQWGDEGKGKAVDVLAPYYQGVARFQGGPNAGHSLEFDGKKFVLRSVPSGVFRAGVYNLIGNGVVLDPILFYQETRELKAAGVRVEQQVRISRKAHLILPTHRYLDAALERMRSAGKIGSTGKGIGPAYTSKAAREGVRVGDVEFPELLQRRYAEAKAYHVEILRAIGADLQGLEDLERDFFSAVEALRSYELVDSEYEVNRLLSEGKRVLAEGAQGTLLDVDFGTYPFVTSSNTMSGGACVGLGVSPKRIGEVYGIVKAYCTRVGEGPFFTELHDDIGNTLREKGHEKGAVTGRPRRCGWLDMVALKYSVLINGVTRLIMTKADVLTGFDEVKVGVGYVDASGKRLNSLPYDTQGTLIPEYRSFRGWNEDITSIRDYEALPLALREYIEFIERETGVPVAIVSVGPDREQTIARTEFMVG